MMIQLMTAKSGSHRDSNKMASVVSTGSAF